MSPLSYGVAPFTANREKRSLKIDIGCQKIAKPGEPLFISYKTNRPSKIVVFAVDEGILQVTGYEVPDPLAHYFRKYALNVQTSQIVDLIMPEYSVLKSSAYGGDDEAKHLNPFKRVTDKPVVFWSGVLDADSSEKRVCYNVPDYFNGTLSVMAGGDVAGCGRFHRAEIDCARAVRHYTGRAHACGAWRPVRGWRDGREQRPRLRRECRGDFDRRSLRAP